MALTLQVKILNFGECVLWCLTEQCVYCDVSVLVKGHAFEPHPAVLAAAAPAGWTCSQPAELCVELPAAAQPQSFQQILRFCYAGQLSMNTGSLFLFVYTAGFLRIQEIMEKDTGFFPQGGLPQLRLPGPAPQEGAVIGAPETPVAQTSSWRPSAPAAPCVWGQGRAAGVRVRPVHIRG